MKGYLRSAPGLKMELEFVEVNPDGRSRTLDHFSFPRPPLVTLGFSKDFQQSENNRTVLTMHYISQRR